MGIGIVAGFGSIDDWIDDEVSDSHTKRIVVLQRVLEVFSSSDIVQRLIFPPNRVSVTADWIEREVCILRSREHSKSDYEPGWFTYMAGAVILGVGVALSPVLPVAGPIVIGVGAGMMGSGISIAGEEKAKNSDK